MDERVKDAMSLMLDALLILDECQQYIAAAHLQHAIDILTERPNDGIPPQPPT